MSYFLVHIFKIEYLALKCFLFDVNIISFLYKYDRLKFLSLFPKRTPRCSYFGTKQSKGLRASLGDLPHVLSKLPKIH